jgi:hypothetical protein
MKIKRPFFFFGGKGIFCLEKLSVALLSGGSPAIPAEMRKRFEDYGGHLAKR